MNNSFEKKSGIALFVFVTLLVGTMVLHPTGGSIDHLIKITTVIVITHSIAILSLPIGWIGFWGLTLKLGKDHFGSILAQVVVSLALIAVLLAAVTNGLVLPIFLNHTHSTPETSPVIELILQYSFAVNHAFDYIYTGAFCLAILCWSISIVHTRKIAQWIGWLGIALVPYPGNYFYFWHGRQYFTRVAFFYYQYHWMDFADRNCLIQKRFSHQILTY